MTFVSFGNSSDEHIQCWTEYFPPYSYLKSEELVGFSVELLKAMDEEQNITIQLVPWARALNNAKSIKNNCVFSTVRTEAREDQFKWVGPIINNRIVLFTKADSSIKINSLADLDGLEIGVIIEDVAENILVDQGVDLNTLQRIGGGQKVLSQSIKKLQSGRIDVFAYDEAVFHWELKQLGIDANEFSSVYTLHEGELYIAFNKQTDNQIIFDLQAKLDQFRKQGVFQKIFQRAVNRNTH